MKEKSKKSWGPIACAMILAVIIIIIAAIMAASMQANASKAVNDAKNAGRNYPIVINDENPYEFGGEYDEALKRDLVYPPDIYGEATLVEKATYAAFSELRYALAKQGMDIGLYSAYRSEADQQAVYDYYSNLEGWAENYV